MPQIIVYWHRLEKDKKVACVAALTEAFEKSTGHSAELLTIHLEEHSYDNVAVGGRLLTDCIPELAERERLLRRVAGVMSLDFARDDGATRFRRNMPAMPG